MSATLKQPTGEGTHSPLDALPGPLMLDLVGASLSDKERQLLQHPLVGGVILFARNFSNSAQLCTLTAQIRAAWQGRGLITVDQEGGRVQRFRGEGFSRLPPMRTLGKGWGRDPAVARRAAHNCGLVLGYELRRHGVDLSFTPVLDLDYGTSEVIGDRAFHRDPKIVSELSAALCAGLAEAGMGCVGKHFPGHGFTAVDSHLAMPRDEREFDAIWEEDLAPYRDSVASLLQAIMPAHVIYERVDPHPAGFSAFWLQTVLRQRLGFDGIVFSDDLTMEAACVAGDIVARAQAAVDAGCDMVLVCNRPDLVATLLQQWSPTIPVKRRQRLRSLQCAPLLPDDLASAYTQAQSVVSRLVVEAESTDGILPAAK